MSIPTSQRALPLLALALVLSACGGATPEPEHLTAPTAAAQPAAAAHSIGSYAEPPMPPRQTQLCEQMRESAHETFGGRPAMRIEAAIVQRLEDGRRFAGCALHVTVDDLALSGVQPLQLLPRLQREFWQLQRSRRPEHEPGVAFALQRELQLCFLRWSPEVPPAHEPLQLRFDCAFTDSEDAQRRS